jgi:2-polyprenyl-3-methyl-5-hydroxy-6-metoxy-1,4-benzoquinol methylase
VKAPDPVSWSGEPAEFDDYAAEYEGGLDNPVKRLLGSSPDQFIAVKTRWLLRREPGLRTGGLSVLDYGCGIGSLMRVLVETGGRAEFTGCDISTGMLGQVAKRWPGSLAPVPVLAAQQGARTPFGDGQFDVATISAVLHHVPVAERPAVYAELGRVLKPGGGSMCSSTIRATRWCATSSPARRSTGTRSCSIPGRYGTGCSTRRATTSTPTI